MIAQVQSKRPYWLLIVAVAILTPLIVPTYTLYLLVQIMIYGMIVASLQLLAGRTGLLSLGHAAFVGVGAYGSAYLTKEVGMPFWVAFVAAALLGMALAVVLAPVLRLRHIYFAMATFAIGIMVSEVFVQWITVTGGHDGLPGIPPLRFGFDLSGPFASYYVILAFLVLQYVLFRRFTESPFGISLEALRQNEVAAAAIGIDLFGIKLRALLIAGATAAAAGSLLAHTQGAITPQLFAWNQSLGLLTMAVVGGIQSFVGAIVGTLVLRLAVEYMRDLAQYTGLIYGVILAGFMLALPTGLVGIANAVWERMIRRSGPNGTDQNQSDTMPAPRVGKVGG